MNKYCDSKQKIFYLWISLTLILVSFLFFSCNSSPQKSKTLKNVKKIGITQIASHPGLDEFRQGVISGLREKGWKEGENLVILFRNANRDPNLTVPIAQYFLKEKVDLIVPITTPSAVAAAKISSIVPIVFGGVTDPIGMGLVNNLEKPGHNITGTSDIWPFDASISFFLKALPNLRVIGMIYTPGDNVSKIGIEHMRALAGKGFFKLYERPISSAGDLYSVARELFLKVDAIYTGMDNMVVENLESVLKAGFEAMKPVLAGDHGSAERGALAAMGIDQTVIGKETGYIAARVLQGESPGEIPIFTIRSGIPAINLTTANKLRITIPSDILKGCRIIGK